eukprot:TRINITY_DN61044_c0_g1_i1.p1 TRINITY_DN61044_c0_g1~~TRINITY_DN61044_c0_g1_i1.p1  ORF type:complete len:516 (-),score=31.61 TRINITY_DN61044_c0_g1_i1:40-1587(-)
MSLFLLLCWLFLLWVVFHWFSMFRHNIYHRKLSSDIPLPLLGWNVFLVLAWVGKVHQLALKRHVEKKRGPLALTWYTTIPSITVVWPSALQRVLVNKWESYDRSQVEIDLFGELLGGGLILEHNGERWRRARTLLAPGFTSKAVRGHVPLIIEETSVAIDRMLAIKGPFDLQYELTKLTFEIVGHLTLGVSFNTHKNTAIMDGWYTILDHYMWRLLTSPLPYWRYIKTAGVKKYDKAMDLLNTTCYEAIAARDKALEEQAKNGADNTEELRQKDVLTMLIQARREGISINPDDSRMSDNDIVKHLLTFLFAGHDTTTNLIAWAIYFLLSHPKVKQEVEEEINSVFGDSPQRGIEYEDLQKLKFMQCVVKETLRLKPSAPLRGRICTQDEVLEGHKIPAGRNMGWSPYVTQRLPEYWDRPNEFDPHRWLDPSRLPSSSFAWIPFGAGPRRCIGEPIARAETTIVLIEILRRMPNLQLAQPVDSVQDEVTLTMRIHGKFMVEVPQERSTAQPATARK